VAIGLCVAGCSALPTAGPTARQVISQQTDDNQQSFDVVDIDDRVVQGVLAAPKEGMRVRFPDHGALSQATISVGDSLVVTIWEAAGGGLFASAASDQVVPGSRSVTLPEQIVGRDGAISVPFAGRILVARATPAEAQHAIERRLSGKAIDPQAIVSVSKSVHNTVTVTGEAIGGARIPLSVKGDRLLDVIAQAGGSHAPVYGTFVRLSRGAMTATIPMEALVSDPRENIYAEPGDVLTVERAP
jgi:polysaccharide export outer membrane protein